MANLGRCQEVTPITMCNRHSRSSFAHGCVPLEDMEKPCVSLLTPE